MTDSQPPAEDNTPSSDTDQPTGEIARYVSYMGENVVSAVASQRDGREGFLVTFAPGDTAWLSETVFNTTYRRLPDDVTERDGTEHPT